MRTNLDVDERAVFLAMPPDPIFVRQASGTRNALQKCWHILDGTDVLDTQRQKLFPRVSVILDRRRVDVDNCQAFEIVDPDRILIAFTEGPVPFFGNAQSPLGLLELGNIARQCVDQSLLCEWGRTPREPLIGTILAAIAVLERNGVHASP